MIAALAPLFIAEFAHYRDVLVLHDDPRAAMPLPTLLSAEVFDETLGSFSAQYAEGDRRGLASIWTKYYFIKLIPPVVAASLILDHRLPLQLDHLQLVLDEQGMPQAFKLPGPGKRWTPKPADPFERFADLLEDHMRPFIDAIAGHVNVSPKVLWSNAGNYFEWLLGVLAAAMPHADLSHGRELLATQHLPDGSRNPLYQPVRYLRVAGQAGLKRQRRVCCVRYLVGGLAFCENCPLPNRKGRTVVDHELSLREL